MRFTKFSMQLRDYYSLMRSAIVAIVSLVILILSFKGHVIYYWDQGFIPYGSSNQLSDILNLWIPQRGLGELGGTIDPLDIFIEIQYITSLFLPAWISEMLTIWIFYYLGGLGTIIFVEYLLGLKNFNMGKRLAIIASSVIFYYGVPWWWFYGGLFNPIQWPDIVAEGLMPWLFIYTSRIFDYLKDNKIDFKSFILIYIISILLINNFNVWNLILLIIFIPYLVYTLFVKIRRIKDLFKAVILLLFLTIILYFSLKPFEYITTLYAENIVNINTNLISSSLNIYKYSSLNLSSVLISPILAKGIISYDEPRFLLEYYQNPINIYLIDLSVLLIIFLPLIIREKTTFKHYIPFASLLIVIITLWIGAHIPFIYMIIKYLFYKVPVFLILRYSWVALDFVMPFLLTLLFSSGIYVILTRITKNKKTTVFASILLILLSISYGYPVLAGDGIQLYFQKGPSPYINDITPYVYISDLINHNTNLTTVIVLPPTYTLYLTKEYLGLDIYYWLLPNKNILDGGYLESPGSKYLYWTFYSALLNHEIALANNLLSILNVKYIILEGDALYLPDETMPSFNLTEIENDLSLLNVSVIGYIKQIYLFEYKNPVGLFYSPDNVIIANLSDVITYLSYSNYSAKNTVIITPFNHVYNISPSQLSLLDNFKKLHRAEILDIKQNSWEDFCVLVNSTGPFILVFSQTFSPYWTVYVNGTQLPNEDHFVAYGFANAWLINKSGLLKIEVTIPIQNSIIFLYIKYFGIDVILLILFYLILVINRRWNLIV